MSSSYIAFDRMRLPIVSRTACLLERFPNHQTLTARLIMTQRSRDDPSCYRVILYL